MRTSTRCLLMLTLCSGFATRGNAQTDKCETAAFVVSRSKLPPAIAPDWNAWRVVANCGRMDVFVASLASPQVTSETDTDRLTVLFSIYAGRLDGTLFTAYSNAVLSNAASDAFRVEAMRALGGLVFPSLDIRISPAGAAPPVCRVGARRLVDGDATPSTLPSDAFARGTATFTSVAITGNSPAVRFAAKCWQDLLERHTPVDLSKISISYICGTKYRVTNGNHRGVALNFKVGATADSGEFGVPKSGEYLLTVATMGAISVYEGTKFIGSATNGGATCR